MSLFHTKHLLCTILRGFGYIVRALVLGLLHGYRYTFGLLLPGSCRFSPTCSAYAIEAIRVHGILKGMVMAGCRLAKCHPWSRCSGYHPVAEKCPSPNTKKMLKLDKKTNQPAM